MCSLKPYLTNGRTLVSMAVSYFTLMLLAASCTTIRYSGSVVAPSDKVDIFFALEDIERPYTVMGEMSAHAQANKVSVERMQRKLIEAAMDRGADALVYVSSEKSEVPNTDYYQQFRDPDERMEFGPPPTDTVRIVKALLVKYGELPKSRDQ